MGCFEGLIVGEERNLEKIGEGRRRQDIGDSRGRCLSARKHLQRILFLPVIPSTRRCVGLLLLTCGNKTHWPSHHLQRSDITRPWRNQLDSILRTRDVMRALDSDEGGRDLGDCMIRRGQ